MQTVRLGFLFGLVMLIAPTALAQDGASAVVMTFEDVYVAATGEREVLGTGTAYLTPTADGRFRIDRQRAISDAVEQTTEIIGGGQRTTINHNMRLALRGPANTWWETPSLAPIATINLPVDDGHDQGSDGRDSAEQFPTGNVMTVGPAILLEWEGHMGDGTRIVAWQDRQSGQFVSTQIFPPDGSMTGEVITSAARVQVDRGTFEIPSDYQVRSIAGGGQR